MPKSRLIEKSTTNEMSEIKSSYDFDVNKPLPEDLCYRGAENHLYRIGLCPTKDEFIKKSRKWFHRPFLVFITIFSFLIQRIVTTLVTDNKYLSIVLGDWTSLVGFGGLYTGAAYVLLSLLVFGWQSIYIYNYLIGLSPTFLSLFQMMSGSMSPNEVGLSKKKTIVKMTKQMKRICTIMQFNSNYVGSSACVIVSTTGYLLSASLTDAVLFGIPNTVLLVLFTFYFWEVVSYQIIYIHFICRYFKYKIQELNDMLSDVYNKQNVNSFYRIDKILHSFDTIYSEINVYNKTYLSKLFLVFWTTFGSSTVFYLYISLYGQMIIYVRILCVYFLLLFIAIFQFLIFTASSVHYKAYTTYRILNKVFISRTRGKNSHNMILVKLKMGILLDRLSQRKIGFSCWRLFIIDYFRCYEIISAMVLLFLKIIEVKRNNSLV